MLWLTLLLFLPQSETKPSFPVPLQCGYRWLICDLDPNHSSVYSCPDAKCTVDCYISKMSNIPIKSSLSCDPYTWVPGSSLNSRLTPGGKWVVSCPDCYQTHFSPEYKDDIQEEHENESQREYEDDLQGEFISQTDHPGCLVY